jgi:queuine/archaeosine tRNA-ribosyltransferase
MIKGKEAIGMTLATIHNLNFYQSFMSSLNRNRDNIDNLKYEDILKDMRYIVKSGGKNT